MIRLLVKSDKEAGYDYIPANLNSVLRAFYVVCFSANSELRFLEVFFKFNLFSSFVYYHQVNMIMAFWGFSNIYMLM